MRLNLTIKTWQPELYVPSHVLWKILKIGHHNLIFFIFLDILVYFLLYKVKTFQTIFNRSLLLLKQFAVHLCLMHWKQVGNVDISFFKYQKDKRDQTLVYHKFSLEVPLARGTLPDPLYIVPL